MMALITRTMRLHFQAAAFTLLCVSASYASSALDGWVPITKTGDFIVYAKSIEARSSNKVIRLWEMKDYFKAQSTSSGRSYFSTKVHSEYDCSTRTTRFLALAFYSEHLGYGQVVSLYEKALPWSSIAPGTVSDQLLAFACIGRS